VHYDEHFLADTARGIGQHFEGTALFSVLTGFAASTLFGTETRHRGCGRLLASDTGHMSSMGASRSGIPWAETWPAMRYCADVAILSLRPGKRRIEPFADCSALLLILISQSP
jgi:hypothetical protein